MRSIIASLIFTLGLFAVASAQSPKPTFSTGYIQASCAPWDGPAIAITLASRPFEPKSEPKPPSLNINIWKDLPLHDGQTLSLGSSQTGSAIRCMKEGGACEVATSAEIRIDRFKAGSGASGHYEFHFKNGDTLSGAFDVKWVDVRMMCG
jgi:hypothetical protein